MTITGCAPRRAAAGCEGEDKCKCKGASADRRTRCDLPNTGYDTRDTWIQDTTHGIQDTGIALGIRATGIANGDVYISASG